MSRALPILLVALSFATGPLIAIAGTRAADDAVQLVVIPPWRSSDTVLARAGARPIGPDTAPLAIFARDDSAAADDTLTHRLREAGAWFVLDGSVLAGICGIA